MERADSPQIAGHASSCAIHFSYWISWFGNPDRRTNRDLCADKLHRGIDTQMSVMVPLFAGEESSEQFVGNATATDHFRILDKDDFSIIVGGRYETIPSINNLSKGLSDEILLRTPSTQEISYSWIVLYYGSITNKELTSNSKFP